MIDSGGGIVPPGDGGQSPEGLKNHPPLPSGGRGGFVIITNAATVVVGAMPSPTFARRERRRDAALRTSATSDLHPSPPPSLRTPLKNLAPAIGGNPRIPRPPPEAEEGKTGGTPTDAAKDWGRVKNTPSLWDGRTEERKKTV
ncbi:hypothetical protein niasHS_011698 [Heterodera schachtii]|uniref:Uncharacterized protein n=1 Tax=Heterodera schachtii TaxID=97005 RepID=A0ABD2IN14_HETSC